MRRVCVITGGNSGIGRAAAIALAAAGHSVVIVCRNRGRGEQALEAIRSAAAGASVELVVADMALQSSIREAAPILSRRHPHIDALIHNAADFDIARKAPCKTREGIETVWATNHLGPVLLTELLLDALRRSPQGRVLTVSSKGLVMYPHLEVDLQDPELEQGRYTVQRAYYQSKLAQVMYTYWLADRFAGSPLTANCIRVTNVKVDLSRYPDLGRLARFAYAIKRSLSISPEKMARAYVDLATSKEAAGMNGNCFDERGRAVGTSTYSRDRENIRKLMEVTDSYLKRG